MNSGILESVMDIFVGGATGSAGRMNRSLLRIRGGRLTGLSLTIGEGLGSNSTIEIMGSAPQSISALEFVEMHARSDPGGTPAVTTLSFILDAHGVTPIVISSRFQGLVIDHDQSSRCRLDVKLSSVPPRDDITLIQSRASGSGEFSGLPEASQVTADFNGHTYTWTLTYRGGTSGHDVVLHNTSIYPPDAPVTHSRSTPNPAPPSWYGHPVFPLAIKPGIPAFSGAEGYGATPKADEVVGSSLSTISMTPGWGACERHSNQKGRAEFNSALGATSSSNQQSLFAIPISPWMDLPLPHPALRCTGMDLRFRPTMSSCDSSVSGSGMTMCAPAIRTFAMAVVMANMRSTSAKVPLTPSPIIFR